MLRLSLITLLLGSIASDAIAQLDSSLLINPEAIQVDVSWINDDKFSVRINDDLVGVYPATDDDIVRKLLRKSYTAKSLKQSLLIDRTTGNIAIKENNSYGSSQLDSCFLKQKILETNVANLPQGSTLLESLDNLYQETSNDLIDSVNRDDVIVINPHESNFSFRVSRDDEVTLTSWATGAIADFKTPPGTYSQQELNQMLEAAKSQKHLLVFNMTKKQIEPFNYTEHVNKKIASCESKNEILVSIVSETIINQSSRNSSNPTPSQDQQSPPSSTSR